jgi:hypothetical protein
MHEKKRPKAGEGWQGKVWEKRVEGNNVGSNRQSSAVSVHESCSRRGKRKKERKNNQKRPPESLRLRGNCVKKKAENKNKYMHSAVKTPGATDISTAEKGADYKIGDASASEH